MWTSIVIIIVVLALCSGRIIENMTMNTYYIAWKSEHPNQLGGVKQIPAQNPDEALSVFKDAMSRKGIQARVICVSLDYGIAGASLLEYKQ